MALRAWVGGVLESPTVIFDAPASGRPGAGVSLYLLELVERLQASGPAPPQLQLSLRYLVTTWAQQPDEAHRMLGQLAFAAMAQPDYEVELRPVAAETWLALGAPPQPSFVIRLPLRQERRQPELHYVTKPVVLQLSSARALYGLVLGPADVPVAGARVELPALRLAAETDARGRFHFDMVPDSPRPAQLHVEARGQAVDVAPSGGASEQDPFVIRLQLPGG